MKTILNCLLFGCLTFFSGIASCEKQSLLLTQNLSDRLFAVNLESEAFLSDLPEGLSFLKVYKKDDQDMCFSWTKINTEEKKEFIYKDFFGDKKSEYGQFLGFDDGFGIDNNIKIVVDNKKREKLANGSCLLLTEDLDANIFAVDLKLEKFLELPKDLCFLQVYKKGHEKMVIGMVDGKLYNCSAKEMFGNSNIKEGQYIYRNKEKVSVESLSIIVAGEDDIKAELKHLDIIVGAESDDDNSNASGSNKNNQVIGYGLIAIGLGAVGCVLCLD